MIPLVLEESGGSERVFDIYSRLLRERIIFLGEQVTSETANRIVAQLLFLEAEDPEKDIYMYINSPGGSVYDGLGIFDTMQHVKPDIHTVCVGLAASMGAFLLAAGTKGKRSSLRHSRIMIHQPLGGARGQASDIRIQADEILFLKERLNTDRRENYEDQPDYEYKSLLVVIDEYSSRREQWSKINHQKLGKYGIYNLWRIKKSDLNKYSKFLVISGFKSTWENRKVEKF